VAGYVHPAARTAFAAALSRASAFSASRLARSASRSACSAAFLFVLEPVLGFGQTFLRLIHCLSGRLNGIVCVRFCRGEGGDQWRGVRRRVYRPVGEVLGYELVKIGKE
jgi:hypothetical protein